MGAEENVLASSSNYILRCVIKTGQGLAGIDERITTIVAFTTDQHQSKGGPAGGMEQRGKWKKRFIAKRMLYLSLGAAKSTGHRIPNSEDKAT